MNNIWIIAAADGKVKSVGDAAHDALEKIEHHEVTDGHGHHVKGPMDPDAPMFYWTLGIFIVLLAVLYKVAWKPILSGLDEREDTIRKSLDDAEEATKKLAAIQEESKKVVADAEQNAKALVTEARDTAKALAKDIEEKAKAEAQSVRDGALKDIESAKAEAMQSLRAESTDLAISLAGKLLGENLDNEKNRSLTEKLINKI
ncbi:MAG: F0F1 ATP synthase subunit B [Lentisphaeraceae bacterium]|nr:F0F1 ATP synthase subunit B [Lentisphaeraceae bacterium]